MTRMRVTHLLQTGYRAAELAPGIFGIESQNRDGTVAGVASGATIARRCVSVDPIDADGATLEASDEQIERAREIHAMFEAMDTWHSRADGDGQDLR